MYLNPETLALLAEFESLVRDLAGKDAKGRDGIMRLYGDIVEDLDESGAFHTTHLMCRIDCELKWDGGSIPRYYSVPLNKESLRIHIAGLKALAGVGATPEEY